MEQGSYLLIENGMAVRGTDAEIGSVAQVIADPGMDVFRGLIITHGHLLPRQGFLSAEQIISVIDGVVHVSLTRTEAENLPPPAAANPSIEA
jgi:uncharacterized protein YrrD